MHEPTKWQPSFSILRMALVGTSILGLLLLYYVFDLFNIFGLVLAFPLFLTGWMIHRLIGKKAVFKSEVLNALLILSGITVSLFLFFWLLFVDAVGKGLEEDARKRQQTTGESLFGG